VLTDDRSRGSRKRRPGRGATPGIVRRQDRSGYRATARLGTGTVRSFFTDLKHGGAAGALDAAVKWRRAVLEEAGVPNPCSRRVVLRPRSGSGIVGVHLREGRGVWVATFETAAGHRLSREYSQRKHGPDGARELAVAQRCAWEQEHMGRAVIRSVLSRGHSEQEVS
jgi:hypothetical protein